MESALAVYNGSGLSAVLDVDWVALVQDLLVRLVPGEASSLAWELAKALTPVEAVQSLVLCHSNAKCN